MTKRALAAILWFYAGWYAGEMLAEILGVSPLIGPVIGAAAAGFITIDPFRLFWARPTTSSSLEVSADPA